MKKVNVGLDQVREIYFPVKAVVELERRFNKPIFKLLSTDFISFELICSVLTIGLKHGGMKLKGKSVEEQEEYVQDLIQEHWLEEGKRFESLVETTFSALEAAGLTGKKDEEEDESNPDEDTDDAQK